MCIALSYKYKIFEKNKVILDVCLKVRCLYECVLKKLCTGHVACCYVPLSTLYFVSVYIFFFSLLLLLMICQKLF